MRRWWRAIAVIGALTLLLPVNAQAASGVHFQLSPTKGPVGTRIHVSGTGCTGAGTFGVSNGSGVTVGFNSAADGSFAFDYTVPPAEAGQQSPDSVYGSDLYCASTDHHTTGTNFEITGPSFTLDPPSAPAGATVRVKGSGCVQDGNGSDDGQLIFDGNTLRTFKATDTWTFDFTFTVPTGLTVDRKYVVQVNCLIQRLESAAGDGGQRFVEPALLLVTTGTPAITTTTAPPRRHSASSARTTTLLSAVALFSLLAALIFGLRRRRQVRQRQVAPAPEPGFAPPRSDEVTLEELDHAISVAPKLSTIDEEALAAAAGALEEAERLAREDAERLAREEAERLAREEAERLAREETERLAREETERLAREEQEREAMEQAARAEAAAHPRRAAPLKARRLAPVRLKNGAVSYPEPPYAEQQPFELTAFGDVRVDPYYWLRERDNPEVIAYLEAENAYTDKVLEPLADLRQTLFDTIKARTKEDDTTPAVPLRGWEYYVRTAEGAQYPDSCRRPRGGGAETVILDRNAMAEGHDYLSCVGPSISPNDELCLYATDFDGSEKYTIRVRNLATLDDLPDEIPATSGDMCWVTDEVFLYVMLDEAHRPYQVRRHVLGDDATLDPIIYEDDDDRFFVHVTRDLAGRFVFVHSGSKIANEDHFLRVEDPLGPLTVIEPRVDNLEYQTCDDGEQFVILTNADGAVDFKLVTAPVDRPDRAHWVDLLPHRPGTRVTEVTAFRTFLAVGERHDALTTIRLLDKTTGSQQAMHHQEAVYAAAIDANAEFDTTTLRFSFTSLNTPMTWIDYDVATQQRRVVKQTEVLGDFSPDDYVTAREWAVAEDGTRIPISILHRRGFVPDGSSPCLLYGYGSYEISIDPYFSIARLNLVDRGVVFAIAHIRGGGEMGRNWYESGKMLHKRNTFTDFIASARHLVAQGWSAPDKLVARGGSAGGLLMGAVMNMAPQLFNTVVAEVPFVDVVTTMSDETIPLTVTEWEEWGNPRDNADDYQYMKSYSPYDNVDEMNYPALYVEAGLNDPRVQYWEPAKWVAKLRVTKTDDRPLVLKTEMGAGHGGPSGRYRAWEDEARVQAFILDQLGING